MLTTSAPDAAPRQRQLALFSDADGRVLEELRRADPERMTPLEALQLLAELRKAIDRS